MDIATILLPFSYIGLRENTMIELCPKCSTILYDAPGIGPYCPNQECDVIDNIIGWDQPRPIFKTKHISGVVEIFGERYVKIPQQIDWKVGDVLEWDYFVGDDIRLRKM